MVKFTTFYYNVLRRRISRTASSQKAPPTCRSHLPGVLMRKQPSLAAHSSQLPSFAGSTSAMLLQEASGQASSAWLPVLELFVDIKGSCGWLLRWDSLLLLTGRLHDVGFLNAIKSAVR